jgi:vesicle coat complex subunit
MCFMEEKVMAIRLVVENDSQKIIRAALKVIDDIGRGPLNQVKITAIHCILSCDDLEKILRIQEVLSSEAIDESDIDDEE